ncbi:MAG: hypothetical protein ABSA97_07365 [Verrucomicrobiia bacterium]
MQELRAKLSLNLRDWKASLAEARRDMATGFRPPAGAGPMAGLFTSQMRSLKDMAAASAGLRLNFDKIGGPESRLGKFIAPFTAMQGALRGLGQMVRPGGVDLGLRQQLGKDLFGTESELTTAQFKVRQKINQLRKQTGIKESAFDFWKFDPRMTGVVGNMERAQAAVAKARDAYQSAAKGVPVWDRILGGGVQFLVNFGTALSGLARGAIAVGSVFFSVFRAIGSVVISVAKTIVSAIGSALTFLGQTFSVAGAAAGAALVAGLRSAFAYVKDLVNLRALTGIPVGTAATIGQAAGMADISLHNVGTELNRMQHNLSGVDEESKKTKAALAALGLNLADLQKMTAAQQIDAIGKALRNLKNPADRAAAVIDIFTVRGHEMIAFLNQAPELMKLAAEQLGRMPEIQQKFAGPFAFLSRSIEGIGIKFRQLFTGIGAAMAGPLTYLADKFNKLDFTQLGLNLGAHLRGALNFFIGAWHDKTFKLSEFLALALKAGFAEGVAFGKSAWGDLGKPLTAVVLDALAVVKQALIYGFEAAAPFVAEILGKAIGAGIGVVKNIEGMIEEAILRKNIRQAKEANAFYEAGHGGRKPFREMMIKVNEADIAKYQKRVDEIEEAKRTNVGATSSEFGATARKFAVENIPAADPAKMIAGAKQIQADWKTVVDGLGPAIGKAMAAAGKTPEGRALMGGAMTPEDAAEKKRLADELAAKQTALDRLRSRPGGKDVFLESAAEQDVKATKDKIAALDAKAKGVIPTLIAAGTAEVAGHPVETGAGYPGGGKELGPAEPKEKRGHGEREITDQFSRVGLFATRTTGAASDYMRRVADNTAKCATLLEQIVKTGTHTGGTVQRTQWY